jgi:two-component system, OmpR family, sensor histidine kinase CpxA
MPRSLFLKIFIWFGSAMLTMIVIAFLVSEFVKPEPFRIHYHLIHLFMILVSAAFCFWLARYLTAPVTKLRRATNDLANGKLGARVGPSLGKRRDELASLAADFDRMAERIESLLDAQRRLLGDISHELRSPLARLNVALELARERSGPEATTALERIHQEAETLNALIGQVLALTRLETGSRQVNATNFDLTKLVHEIADDADFEARSRNCSVRLSCCNSVMMVGSKELLRPAIENVVRNAIQHTGENTAVEIDIRASEVSANGTNNSIRAVQSPGSATVEITIRDHGNGVPEAALTEIFRPFYRVDDARDRESGGTGLGLAIAERAVRLHEGTLAAINAPDGGLIVTINLPAQL